VSVFPVFFDAAPSYLRGGSRGRSLLLAPMGAGRLVCQLHERFSALAQCDLTVVPAFRPDRQYQEELYDACRRVKRVVVADEFADFVSTLEASDSLLIIDPKCALADGVDPNLLLEAAPDMLRGAVHLVPLETNSGGTCEWVDVDERGDVTRIQRFYDSFTWSYGTGVAASLVPVPSLLMARDLDFRCLKDIRTSLASLGVPSRDIPVSARAFNLIHEHELLMLSERVARAAYTIAGARQPHIGPGAKIHETARLFGPVIVQDGAEIEAHATIIGPSTIGASARVGSEALVVQSVVQPEATIAAGAVVRHRLVAGNASDELSEPVGYDPSRTRVFGPELRDEPRRRRFYPGVKVAIESAIATLALILLSPLLALIALLIRLESRGPVLFRDRREARGGKTFHCLKFRTMVQGAEGMQRDLLTKNEVDGPQFKLDKDPRVTRIGRWIRPCSIDELPQLVNVARGEMSLVGPRPSPFRENQTCVPWREGRLSVRPGITGLWQVCRNNRSNGDFHQWIYYDLLYVKHVSAQVDLKIILATIFTLGGKWCVPLKWIIPDEAFQRPAA
jgi:lipopolysaccharide/colanic/teichoic acid biosynthesis glycosyltransferase/carbonic anhydrase/acetyltransferase-like protein (isoleucine patch superfamily)